MHGPIVPWKSNSNVKNSGKVKSLQLYDQKEAKVEELTRNSQTLQAAVNARTAQAEELGNRALQRMVQGLNQPTEGFKRA